jgi:hypothetical protein
LLSSTADRRRLATRAEAAVDGRGVRRVALAIDAMRDAARQR